LHPLFDLFHCNYSDGSGKSRKNGISREGLIERREDGNALLWQRGQGAANTTEHRDPFFGTETTGDFLLDFDHPEIPLGLIVIKRHGNIVPEP
jgi:hypothetical protein